MHSVTQVFTQYARNAHWRRTSSLMFSCRVILFFVAPVCRLSVVCGSTRRGHAHLYFFFFSLLLHFPPAVLASHLQVRRVPHRRVQQPLPSTCGEERRSPEASTKSSKIVTRVQTVTMYHRGRTERLFRQLASLCQHFRRTRNLLDCLLFAFRLRKTPQLSPTMRDTLIPRLKRRIRLLQAFSPPSWAVSALSSTSSLQKSTSMVRKWLCGCKTLLAVLGCDEVSREVRVKSSRRL